jgi:hypothetical protein
MMANQMGFERLLDRSLFEGLAAFFHEDPWA